MSQFHKKFWGTSMKEEEQQWYERQSDYVRQDEGMEDDDDDDIVPGCYVLDINTDLEYRRIWIRAEYIRVYDFLETFYAHTTKHSPYKAPGAVVTGQPGIGNHLDCYC